MRRYTYLCSFISLKFFHLFNNKIPQFPNGSVLELYCQQISVCISIFLFVKEVSPCGVCTIYNNSHTHQRPMTRYLASVNFNEINQQRAVTYTTFYFGVIKLCKVSCPAKITHFILNINCC